MENPSFKNNQQSQPKNHNCVQKFLYSNIEKSFWKRCLLKVFTSKIFSLIISLYLKSFISKIHIAKIVKKNNIVLDMFKTQKFHSYNDFFKRQYKQIFFAKEKNVFISPGDGEISIYPIYKDSYYTIKETKYHLIDLLKNPLLAKEYENGFLIVLRLKPVDYHRYIFVDDGFYTEKMIQIKGKLHTVNPIAFRYFNVFKENSREYSILQTKHFDKIIQMEVGALLVGKINNHNVHYFCKGQEKGFFSLGGSTIILVVKPDLVIFDFHILNNTRNHIETHIHLGDRIGIHK